MAAVPLEPIHRLQRIRRARDELARGEVAEVVRREIREERHADVGGRGSMRNGGERTFLVIVWRQPMIFRSDKRLEKRPGLARNLTQENSFIEREPCFTPRKRPAY